MSNQPSENFDIQTFCLIISGVAKGGPSRAQARPIFCGVLPNDAQLSASVYSKYMYLQINHLFLHERALTVAQNIRNW